MAKPRVFTHPDTHAGVYHVVSRIVDKQFLFGEAEKEAFVRMMRAFAAFHQVQILTFRLRKRTDLLTEGAASQEDTASQEDRPLDRTASQEDRPLFARGQTS